MKVIGATRCQHGVVRAWHIADARPGDEVPAIEHCPVCDEDASLLGVVPPSDPADAPSEGPPP